MAKLIYPENQIFPDLLSFFTEKDFDLKGFCKRYEHYMPIQRHTDKVILLKNSIKPQVGDAVVTNNKGLLIGVQVADCVPILIYEPIKRVIAAVHAGWRNTAKGILKKTIIKMIESFNCNVSDVLIAIGPSIRGCCYEVGREVIEALQVETPSNDYIICFNRREHVDLAVANKIQALSIGIKDENTWICPDCTFCNHTRYASYRYHGKEASRQYGIIVML